MSLALDVFITGSPVNFLSKTHVSMDGYDLFFYVSDTHQLRVKRLDLEDVRILVDGVNWVSVIQVADSVYIYYVDSQGGVNYFPFALTNFFNDVTPQSLGISNAVTISSTYCSSLFMYLLMVDDGINHTLYSSKEPDFDPIIGASRTYNNGIDRLHDVFNPVISIHPEDTTRVTVICQQTTFSDNSSMVRFYVVTVPGI